MINKARETMRKCIKAPDFKLYRGRKDKDQVSTVPQPLDARFEQVQGNIELLSKYENTKKAIPFVSIKYNQTTENKDQINLRKQSPQPDYTIIDKNSIGVSTKG